MQVIKNTGHPDGHTLESIEERAKIIIEKEGEHRPMAILLSKDKIFLCPMKFNNDKEKHSTKQTLREIVQTESIERYWIIMESWLSCNPHISRACRDFDRKEALVISEFSLNESNGKMVTNLFERDGEKIIWKQRVVLNTENGKGHFRSAWNVYKEDISNDLGELREKARIADIVKRTEQADMTEEIIFLRKMWKKDKGTDLTLTDAKIKEKLIEIIKEGKVGFQNGIIPDKLKMDTDNKNKLDQMLKERREDK